MILKTIVKTFSFVLLCIVPGTILLVYAHNSPQKHLGVMIAEHAGAALYVSAVVIVFIEVVLETARAEHTNQRIRKFVRLIVNFKLSCRLKETRILMQKVRRFAENVSELDWDAEKGFVSFISGYFEPVRLCADHLVRTRQGMQRQVWINAPLRKELLDNAYTKIMGTMTTGDEYVTITCPKFWSTWNMGYGRGQFLLNTERVGMAKGVTTKRVFVLFGHKGKDNEWKIDCKTEDILRMHVDLVNPRRSIEVRIVCYDNTEKVRELIERHHMGAWRTKSGHTIALTPVYFNNDPFIVEGVFVQMQKKKIKRMIEKFMELWDEGMEIRQFLSDHVSSESLPEMGNKDPSRPYPGREEWNENFGRLEQLR